METDHNRPELSGLDKTILNLIQKEFPMVTRPFREIARKTGSTEGKVLSRVKWLKDNGIIRRLGGVFEWRKMGFVSTLIALRVSPERLEQVGEAVAALEGVTHNYQRNHDFNLWFTLVTSSREEQERILAEVKNYPGVEELLNLPALEQYKIGVNFKL